MYVGRLEKYKNVHILIKSMVNIPDQYELVIIGDGAPDVRAADELLLDLLGEHTIDVGGGVF